VLMWIFGRFRGRRLDTRARKGGVETGLARDVVILTKGRVLGCVGEMTLYQIRLQLLVIGDQVIEAWTSINFFVKSSTAKGERSSRGSTKVKSESVPSPRS
jgi:hypothetical protein